MDKILVLLAAVEQEEIQPWTKVRVLYLAAEREEIELRCLLTNNLSCALHMPTHT